ncbi:hypothetical protein SAMN05444483_10941 [Salegentibacter echinorum]|uniref:Uncharacterized protein n=1 Tax=Salegentibacter echinorum TaxID=1073325 RepID=A0A1M5IYF5_SALEC|nr:hypothetical protein [Salegentibacter echinorum]SHG33398.1 hypothetical protein SAMN05444483_10941 [Salegentibacter echinorum]
MKRIKHYLMYMAVLSLVMVSCSKEENQEIGGNDDVATLSFGAVINDMISKNPATKQALEELPECSEEAPAYVHVVLTGPENVGTMASPVMVDVNPTPGDFDGDGNDEYFTEYSSDLELMPGSYSLDYFAVYDADDNLIWVAPASGSDMADWVDMALPMDIELGAGVKKYVDVNVLCFDDRMVNQYGYLFFDIIGTEAIEFCIFGNICGENGRHAVADYSVNIWSGTDNTGAVLYADVENNVDTNNDGDEYADPLCFFLPDREGEDNYYIEISIDGEVVRSGSFTDATVKGLFDGEDNVDYYHFFEGCSSSDTPNIFGDNGGNGGPPPVIDEDTEIYIYFDSSGSMNSTLAPLQTMRNTLLKDALLPLYGDDEDEYDAKVRVIQNPTERTFNMLNIEGDTPTGNVIALVFQDEAQFVYHNIGASWDINSPRTVTYDTDISTLRGRVASFPTNYYRGVVFQVDGFDDFEDLIHAVEDGTGNYSGSNGLSDRSEFAYVYDVNDGDSAQYYADLIVQTLQDLGYNL